MEDDLDLTINRNLKIEHYITAVTYPFTNEVHTASLTFKARMVEVVEDISSMEREYSSGSLDLAISSTKLRREETGRKKREMEGTREGEQEGEEKGEGGINQSFLQVLQSPSLYQLSVDWFT